MRALRHIITVSAAILLTLGVPFASSDSFKEIVSGADAVSSASIVVDQPSGNYTVLINLDKHTDAENLALWEKFFAGEEVSFIFEDIKCTAARGDSGGIQLAENYLTRLPENQMTLRTEDPVLMLSKAEYGRFDVIVISKEMADMYGASTVYDKDNIEVISVKGAVE